MNIEFFVNPTSYVNLTTDSNFKTRLGFAYNVQADATSKDKCISASKLIVITGDDGYTKVLPMSEIRNIPKYIAEAGRVSNQALIDSKRFKEEILESVYKMNDDKFMSVAYSRDGLINFNGGLAYVGNNKLYTKDKELDAYKIGKHVGSTPVGDPLEFGKELNIVFKEHIKSQIIFCQLLTGALKQYLDGKVLNLEELGLVMSVQSDPGSGKSTVINNLTSALFSRDCVMHKNMTDAALNKMLEMADINPLIVDDASIDSKKGKVHARESIEAIFNIAQGNTRQRYYNINSKKIYSPYIEARESSLPLSNVVLSNNAVHGHKFRMLELNCIENELVTGDLVYRYNSIIGQYSGMSLYFYKSMIKKEKNIVKKYNNCKEILIQELRNKNDSNGWDSISETDIVDYKAGRNGLEDRYANRLAVLLTAAIIAKDAFKVDLNIRLMTLVMVEEVEKLHKKLYGNIMSTYTKILYKFINEGKNLIAQDKKSYDPNHHLGLLNSDNEIWCQADYFCSLFLFETDETDNFIIDAYRPSYLRAVFGKDYCQLDNIPIKNKILNQFNDWAIHQLMRRTSKADDPNNYRYTFRKKINGTTHTFYVFYVDKIISQFNGDNLIKNDYDVRTAEDIKIEEELSSAPIMKTI